MPCGPPCAYQIKDRAAAGSYCAKWRMQARAMRRVFSELLGKEMLVSDPLKRVVSLSPAVTETLFSIGLGTSVVGVTEFCFRPREARGRTIVGTYSSVDIEALSKLDPELILSMTGFQRESALTCPRVSTSTRCRSRSALPILSDRSSKSAWLLAGTIRPAR